MRSLDSGATLDFPAWDKRQGVQCGGRCWVERGLPCRDAGFFLIIMDLSPPPRPSNSSMIESAVLWLLKVLAAPTVGLTSVFLIAFVSATLLPLGSEPAVFAVVKANPAMFWPAILVATVGNTLGGAVDYWIGYRAKVAFAKERKSRWFHWLARYGSKT